MNSVGRAPRILDPGRRQWLGYIPRAAFLIVGILIFAAIHLGATDRAFAQSGEDIRGVVSGPVIIESTNGVEIQEYTRSVALVIGVSKYSGAGWDSLPTVEQDVIAVRDALVAHGFEVETVENPTGLGLDQKLSEFRRKYGSLPNSRLLIYFAGHGISHQKPDGVLSGWIVPSNAPNPSVDEQGFWKNAISMDFISGYSRGLGAKHVLFVFDSCFSGSIFSSNSRSGGASPALGADIRSPVRYFITAGEADEYVHAKSIFRKLFVDALMGESRAGEFGDGYITGEELGQFLRDEVSRQTSMHKPRYGALPDRYYNKGQFVFKIPVVDDLGPFPEALANFEAGHFSEAVDQFTAAALAGDVPSRKALGDIYSRGAPTIDGVRTTAMPIAEIPLDYVEALSWYYFAIAGAGGADECACGDLGAVNRRERFLAQAKRDARASVQQLKSRMSNAGLAKAEERLSLFYQSGSPIDLMTLAGLYQAGRIFSKNNIRAALYYSLAKERGVGEAAIRLEAVERLMSPSEIDQYRKLRQTWRPPAAPDEISATASIRAELERLKLEEALVPLTDPSPEVIQGSLRALGYYNGPINGRIATSQMRSAIRSFQQAISPVGLTVEEANAVQTGILSQAQTVRLFEDAARTGLADAQYTLGVMHIDGVGVPKSSERAIYWLTLAALQNHPLALYALGVLYRDGSPGDLAPDTDKATSFFIQAREAGYAPAEEALRQLPLEGGSDSE